MTDQPPAAVSPWAGILSVFRRELRANRNRFLTWTIPLSFLVFFALSLFPDMAKGGLIELKMQALPAALRSAMGFDKVDLNQAIGFYASGISVYVTLVGGMFAALLGANALAKEESERTAEFLLTKPISRGAIVAGKASAVFLYVVLFNLVIALVSLLAMEVYAEGKYALDVFVALSCGHFLVVASLAGLGFLASAMIARARAVLPIAMGATLGTYLVGVFSQLGEKLAWLGWFSPFQYADPAAIMASGSLPGRTLLLLVVTGASVAGAYLRYDRKDIAA